MRHTYCSGSERAGLNRGIRVAAAALVLLLAGCAKAQEPEYWIRGLALPSGASVIQQQESQPGQLLTGPLAGKVNRWLSVEFADPGTDSWSSIALHIDGCMHTAGYTEVTAGLDSILAGLQSVAPHYAGGQRRMYAKDGSTYTVVLYECSDFSALRHPIYGLLVLEMAQ